MGAREARRLARIGEFYIQEAILTLLDGAPEGLKLGIIAQVLGLSGAGYNATITGQLHRLRDLEKIHQPRGTRTEWVMTDQERGRREIGL